MQKLIWNNFKMEFEFIDGCKITFLNKSAAKNLVIVKDDYTDTLTKFDLQAKIKTFDSDVGVDRFLINCQRYLYDWQDYEINYLSSIFKEIGNRIKRLNLKLALPAEIFVLKSSMFEEGGANGFTRKNYMVLNRLSYSEHLVEHELFHILSRYNPILMEKSYKILGFIPCNEIEIPEELIELKISNPDAPHNNFFINVTLYNEPVEAIMLIHSDRNYSGGTFFNYLQKSLMLIEGKNGAKQAARDPKGQIMLKKYDEVEHLFEQIGKNTNYNIHVEELTAEHFSFVLHETKGLPNQNLVDELASVLQGSQC